VYPSWRLHRRRFLNSFPSLSRSQERGRLASNRLIRVLIALGENVTAFSPSFPLGADPPVGTCQGTGKRCTETRERRPRPRICFRKGCRRKYLPRCWNQRYCQEPECLRQVRCWQAARRQAKHRQEAVAKARHAQAEKARRQQAKSASQVARNPKVTPARGHAAEIFFPSPVRSARLP